MVFNGFEWFKLFGFFIFSRENQLNHCVSTLETHSPESQASFMQALRPSLISPK